jgi:hypothetical protein
MMLLSIRPKTMRCISITPFVPVCFLVSFLGLLACLPLSTSAIAPATQPVTPTTQPTSRGPNTDSLPFSTTGDSGYSLDVPNGSPRGDHHRLFGGILGRPPLSQDDIKKAREFMQTYSPERYKALQEIMRPEVKNAIEEGTTRMYLSYQRLQTTDPDLYQVVLSRVKVEDKVFGLVSQLNKAGGDPGNKPLDRKSVKTELRDAVSQLVELNLTERDLRLKRLAETLKEQQAALEKDKDPANREQLINDRLDAVMKERQSFGPGRSHGRGNQGRPGDSNASHDPGLNAP